MRTIIALLCVVSCAAVLVGGCSTAGPGPIIPDPEFRDRISPEDVLYNLELAYEEMDLEEYLDCLSEDFEFFPTEADVNDPNWSLPPVWWKADEAAMHENMFADSSYVESINLTLTVASLDYDYGMPEDPLDDVCICVVDVELRLYLRSGNGFLVTTASEFRMCIDTDRQRPRDEPLWEINMWYDLGDPRRGAEAGRVEDASWGRVKAMFW